MQNVLSKWHVHPCSRCGECPAFQDSGPESWPLDCHTSHANSKSRYFSTNKYDFDTEDLAAGLTEDAAILTPLLASESDVDDQNLLGVTESVLTGQAALLKNVLMQFESSDENPNSNPEALPPPPTRATKFVSLPHRRPLYLGTTETQQVLNETGTVFGAPQQVPQLGRGLHSEVPMSFVEEDIKLNRDSPLFGLLDESRTDGAHRDVDLGARGAFARGYGGRSEQEFELMGYDEMHPRPIKSSLKPVLPKISEEQME